MRRTAFTVTALLALFFVVLPAGADDRVLWDYGTKLDLSVLGPDADLGWRVDGSATEYVSVAIPAFRDSGILHDSNYLRFGAGARVSSDTLWLSAETTLELLACAHLRFGGGFGSGWSTKVGTGLVGLGINWDDDAKPIEEIPLGGVVWNAWASIPLTFSMEYVTLDPWQRLVLTAEPKIEYRALSTVGQDTAWVWNNDAGTSFNGFKFSALGFFGYLPPLVWGLQEIGLELGVETWLGEVRELSTIASGGWGSDAWLVSFGGRGRWAFDPWNALGFHMSFGQYLQWTADSTAAHRYFGNRVYSSTGFGLKDVTVSYTYSY